MFHPKPEVILERREIIGKSNTAFLEWYDAFIKRSSSTVPVLKPGVDYFVVNGVIKLKPEEPNHEESNP